MTPSCAVIVFAKAPVAGTVKTRLAGALGAVGAARLAARMLESTTACALEAAVGPVEVCCAPDRSHPAFTALAVDGTVALTEQGDGDLGQRMRRALERTLASQPCAIVIGTDAPRLDAPYLRKSVAALSLQDAVIGPAVDGGYVLIGLRRAAPAALFFLMLFVIPRSPRWLAKKRWVDEAREVLKLTGVDDYEGELRAIVESIDAEHGHADEPLFSRKYALPIFLAISIGMFNQLSGINAILYYLNDIFAYAGFSKVSSALQTVLIGLTNLIFTTIAMSVIDKFGRKKLLLIGAIGTAICLAGVAAVFFTNQRHDLLLWLLVAYIAFFAFSQGAVIWVYLSEVFPNRVRAKGQSLGSFTHWVMNALISGTFPALAAWSKPIPFAFFAGMMVLQFFVVLFIYPETKGVSLEEMQKKLSVA